ncbi:unnamed protein product [Paramecium sonneborni]|uniref:Transmembrane protein n=1 Tax=Paramecium sonneborni TaxID=65129 RepID=A0A8S1QV22_9CILI|nr:unnamed protein product [Paramecium sonneborni]
MANISRKVILQNIQLRKQIDTNYQFIIISKIKLELKIQNQQIHQSIIKKDLKNHQLNTMTIMQGKIQNSFFIILNIIIISLFQIFIDLSLNSPKYFQID